jgi:hypothetical protein
MAVTKLSDLIVPQVWLPYMQELSTQKNNLLNSGIVTNFPEIAARADSFDASTVNMPFLQDLTGADEVLSEATALTPGNIGSAKDEAVICRRGKAWGTGQLARYKTGADPAAAIANLVADYWNRRMQDTLISLLQGVFASTTMAAQHVSDISIADGANAAASNLISSGATIDALKLLGDEIDAITGMVVHSDIYYELEKQNLIEFVAPAEQGAQPIRTYRGRSLVIDDRCPKVAGGTSGFVYDTYLFGAGAIGYGEASMDADEAVQIDRDILAGEEYIAHRKQFIMHPIGVAWQGDTVSGDSPTNAELATASNWARVYSKQNVKLILLKSNG